MLIGTESESQPSQSTPPLKRRGTEPVITLKLATVLDKCRINKRYAVHILNAAAESFQLDPRKYVLNTTSIHEARKSFRKKRYQAIKDHAPRLFSTAITIHWDSKLIPGYFRTEINDRLAIIVTCEGYEQLLGTPIISSSKGYDQAQAIHETLVDWSIHENVTALCCDSTASNRLLKWCLHVVRKVNQQRSAILNLQISHIRTNFTMCI